MKRILGIGVVLVLAVILFSLDKSKSESNTNDSNSLVNSNPKTDNSLSDQPSSRRRFAGDPCTSDCSGHEAGYNWAESHDISDEDDCDQAGETSNSPSFAEGCKAYVRGNSPDEESDGDADGDDQDSDN